MALVRGNHDQVLEDTGCNGRIGRELKRGHEFGIARPVGCGKLACRPQDFPTLRLNFRSADERRPDRDVLAGFRGCGAAACRQRQRFRPRMVRSRCLAAFRRVPDALASQGRVRAAMASLRSSCSQRRFGQALRFEAIGEDHRERDVVGHGPVRRPVARAGQAGVLAVDAVPLSMVQVFDPPSGRGSGGAALPATRPSHRGR